MSREQSAGGTKRIRFCANCGSQALKKRDKKYRCEDCSSHRWAAGVRYVEDDS